MSSFFYIKRKNCDEYVSFYADGIGVVFTTSIAEAEAFPQKVAVYVFDRLREHGQVVKSNENWEFEMVDVKEECATW